MYISIYLIFTWKILLISVHESLFNQENLYSLPYVMQYKNNNGENKHIFLALE